MLTSETSFSMLFPWKRQDMTIFNNNIDLSLSVRRVGLLRLSRWLSLRDRAVFFGIILVTFLPYACSDDPHPLQASQDGSSKYRFAQINITYMDRDKKKEVSSVFEGKYGMNSVIRSASGTVMHAISNHKLRKNHYGCEKYGNQKFPSESWIALVERGECMFTQKIKIATQEHNATAVVIYNNESKEDTVMDHKSLSSISVFITRDDGFLIADQLDKGISVTMHIWPGGEGTVNPLQNSISKTSVLFVSISFIVLMIISLAWLVFYYIQRFRYSHAKERLARRLACAAKKAIAKIPQKTVKVGDKELDSEFDQCAVCIEPYKTHDVIRILPCRHVFHKSCVDPWLLDQRSCPMCKLDILRAYGMQISGSQESVHHDPESGPVTTVVQDEPEVSSSVEDTQTEEVKVLLVPHACLHFHAAGEKSQGEDEEASASLLGAVGGCVPTSVSMNSITSRGSTRAEKIDKDESGSSELKVLIGKGKSGMRRWKNKMDEEEVQEDIEDSGLGYGSNQGIAEVIETVKTDENRGTVMKPHKEDIHRGSSNIFSLSGEMKKERKRKSASKEESQVKKEETLDKDRNSCAIEVDGDGTSQGAVVKVGFHECKSEMEEMESKA